MVSPIGKSAIWGTVGVVLITLAATLGWILFPYIVNSEYMLKEGSQLYTQWINPTVPITMSFYLFNCTNADAVLKGETPEVNQVGPFTYRETRVKQNVTEKDGTLTYREIQTYYYQPTDNDASLSTQITTLNPIYVSLAALINESPKLNIVKKNLLSQEMDKYLRTGGETPFMTHTAEELIFEGWDLENYVGIIDKVNETLHGKIPPIPLPADLRFGFYYGRNETDMGVMNVNSGVNDLDSLASINSWKGSPTLKDVWPTKYCNMINGTDGEVFPPSTAKNTKNDPEKRLYVFNSDLCRSIYAVYENDVTVSGIAGKRFTVPKKVFGSYSENPENRCFCRNLDSDNITTHCYEAGILDQRPCYGGIPLLMSTPHFYLGNEKYVNDVKGMKPNQTLHETFITLEDTSSVVIAASKRIQINLDLKRYNAPGLKHVKPTVFPILWADETISLDQANADQLKTLNAVMLGVDITRWSVIGIGLAMTLGGTIAALVLCQRRGVSV